jgi:hypothetical protein
MIVKLETCGDHMLERVAVGAKSRVKALRQIFKIYGKSLSLFRFRRFYVDGKPVSKQELLKAPDIMSRLVPEARPSSVVVKRAKKCETVKPLKLRAAGLVCVWNR